MEEQKDPQLDNKSKIEKSQDLFLSLVTCYLLNVQDLVQHVQGLRMTNFVSTSGPTTDIPSRKKRAIVQQTIEITDNVAVQSKCTL